MLAFTPWLIKNELERRGYKCTTFDDKYLVLVEKGDIRFWYNCNLTPAQKIVPYTIAKDKYLTKQFLRYYGFPTAKGVKVSADSLELAQNLRFPVVAKPLEESGGKGVVVGIEDFEKLKDHFYKNSFYGNLLVEELLHGKDTRILIIQGKFFAAVQRRPAHVIGDGVHTILELIEIENNLRQIVIRERNRTGKYLSNKRIIQFNDEETKSCLEEEHLDFTSIPTKNSIVWIRRNANLSTGGTSVDVTDLVCHELRSMAEDIADKLNATTLGIDIMTEDLSLPLYITKGWGIIEINTNPGLSMHVFAEGQSRNPVNLIVDEIEEYIEGNKEELAINKNLWKRDSLSLFSWEQPEKKDNQEELPVIF